MGYEYNAWIGGRPTEMPCMQLRLRGATKFGRWLAEHCDVGSGNKHIPDIVWDWVESSRRALFDALMEGDGSIKVNDSGTSYRRYSTASPRLADDVQRLAISLGFNARIVVKPRAEERWRDQYAVYIAERTQLLLLASRHLSEVPYSGKVYCLQVPTGAYITRRNGSMAIAGNTAFWHNLARRTWYVARQQEEDSDDMLVGLYCKKVNDGPKPHAQGLTVHFEAEDGPVTFSPYDVNRSADLAKHTPLQNQIWALLTSPMTPQEIAESLDCGESSVRGTLNRYRDRFVESVDAVSTIGKNGRPAKRWARLQRPEEPVYHHGDEEASF